jgi:hypothetical protein
MESYLNDNFGGVKPKHSSEEALGRWRDAVGVVKNHKRRFRFTANLSKRSEAAQMKRSNQVRAACATSSPLVMLCPVRVLCCGSPVSCSTSRVSCSLSMQIGVKSREIANAAVSFIT